MHHLQPDLPGEFSASTQTLTCLSDDDDDDNNDDDLGPCPRRQVTLGNKSAEINCQTTSGDIEATTTYAMRLLNTYI